MAETERLLYRIAHAYYEENLTQADIAARFGVSRIKISRLLGRARADGIVRITVVPPEDQHTDLEHALERGFGLDEAVVAEAVTNNYPDVISAIGRAAARYLERVVTDGQTIGLTWGNTILSTVAAMNTLTLPNSRVVQMIGGLGEIESEIHGAELVIRMAKKLGCRPRQIHAPGIVVSRTVRDALVDDPQIGDTLQLARTADVALLGIGSFGPNSVLRGKGSVLTDGDCRQLAAQGIVGDIALRFFGDAGEPVENPFDERTIGVSLEEMTSIRRRVAVTGGSEKLAAILAALRSGRANVLVTDKETATALLAESGREQGAP